MEWLGFGILLVVTLAGVVFTVILFTRGIFARDLTQALKRVNQQEQELQAKAEILEQRLRQLEQEYRAKIKHAEVEGEEIVQKAKGQAMNVRTVAMEEAKHRARQLLLEAEQGKAQLKQELAKTLNGQAVRQACEALRALLPPQELAALHLSLVTELLPALSTLDLGSAQAAVERVEVVTAQPLALDQSKRIAQWVAASCGPGVTLQVDTDPSLVAGCLVRVGQTVVDNTLANRLGQSR